MEPLGLGARLDPSNNTRPSTGGTRSNDSSLTIFNNIYLYHIQLFPRLDDTDPGQQWRRGRDINEAGFDFIPGRLAAEHLV